MRLFLLLISLGITAGNMNPLMGQTKINIDVKGISIEEFFEEIQGSSDYMFFYKDDVLNTNKKVSIKLNEANIIKILDKAFSKTNLSYKVDGKQVIVKKTKQKPTISLANNQVKQERVVNGLVVESEGFALPGVSVHVKGTSTGTETDFDGKYSIKVPAGAVLEFSYIGMIKQTVTVGDKTVIDVQMEESTASLEEVVIVGYGSLKKEHVIT